MLIIKSYIKLQNRIVENNYYSTILCTSTICLVTINSLAVYGDDLTIEKAQLSQRGRAMLRVVE